MNLADIPADAEVWEKVIRKVRAGMMPPAGMPRPVTPHSARSPVARSESWTPPRPARPVPAEPSSIA
jgi:hypothetical protein